VRVALVHPYSWPEVRRGGERYLHDLAWYLARAGHDVDVVTGSRRRPSVRRDADGVTWWRLPRLGRPRPEHRALTPMETFGAVAFPFLLRRRYDVVHALMPSGALAARLAGHPTVFTTLGYPSRADFPSPTHERLFRAAVERAHVTTALSHAAAARVEAVAGRTAVGLYPGVRVDHFSPDLSPRTGAPRVLFPSDAAHPRKGVHFALLAVDCLLDRRPGLRIQLSPQSGFDWVMPGLGERRPRVEAALDDLGSTLDELPARYRAATVTVLPATFEAFGLVLVESLAAGTPVVASREGGMPEVVSDERVGRLAPHGDVAALARALDEAIDLAADPATPARCVAHARRWSWEDVVGPAHEELYRSVARR
jgi:phosphatidylinositol alpha-mannosyltransferase